MSDGDRVIQVLGKNYEPEKYDYAVFRRDKRARKRNDGWEVMEDYDESTVLCRRKKGRKVRAAQ